LAEFPANLDVSSDEIPAHINYHSTSRPTSSMLSSGSSQFVMMTSKKTSLSRNISKDESEAAKLDTKKTDLAGDASNGASAREMLNPSKAIHVANWIDQQPEAPAGPSVHPFDQDSRQLPSTRKDMLAQRSQQATDASNERLEQESRQPFNSKTELPAPSKKRPDVRVDPFDEEPQQPPNHPGAQPLPDPPGSLPRPSPQQPNQPEQPRERGENLTPEERAILKKIISGCFSWWKRSSLCGMWSLWGRKLFLCGISPPSPSPSEQFGDNWTEMGTRTGNGGRR
jgi:hypothetical protein